MSILKAREDLDLCVCVLYINVCLYVCIYVYKFVYCCIYVCEYKVFFNILLVSIFYRLKLK